MSSNIRGCSNETWQLTQINEKMNIIIELLQNSLHNDIKEITNNNTTDNNTSSNHDTTTNNSTLIEKIQDS
jgi:hypothetical protein